MLSLSDVMLMKEIALDVCNKELTDEQATVILTDILANESVKDLHDDLSKGTLTEYVNKHTKMKEFDDLFTVRSFPQFHDDDSNGMLETYGEEEQFVRDFINQHPGNIKYVWTITDSEINNNMIISAGFHYVNRVNYIISNEPWTTEDEVYIWCDLSNEEYISEE